MCPSPVPGADVAAYSPGGACPDKSSRAVTTALVLLAVVVAVVLLLPGTHPAALQKMAGYTTSKSAFKDAQEYLNNLRDGLIPLAIPLGAIGLTGGGVAYMMGNVMAQKILGGVVLGLALTLLGPSLVA